MVNWAPFAEPPTKLLLFGAINVYRYNFILFSVSVNILLNCNLNKQMESWNYGSSQK